MESYFCHPALFLPHLIPCPFLELFDFSTTMSYPRIMTYLKDVVDIDRFAFFVDCGLITTRPHPDNPLLRVYSYGKRVQFEGIWTPETRLARGLMLQFDTHDDYETAVIVGRGIPKFFTVEQAGDDWSAMKLVDDDEGVTVDEKPVIPLDAPAHIANKLNGALGLAYITPNGEIAVSTKGSFASVEALVGTKLIQQKLDDDMVQQAKNLILSGYTPLFEIITPERPHPIDYGNLEDLVYLGMVANHDGFLITPRRDDFFVCQGFSYAQQMPYSTLREAVEAPYLPNTEGMVVTINENGVQHLFKVKPEEYLNLRKMFYAIRPKNIDELLLGMTGKALSQASSWEDMHLGDSETVLVNGHASLAQKHKENMFATVVKAQKLVDETTVLYDELLAGTDGSRKEIALAISEQDYPTAVLFAMMKDRVEENYLTYRLALKEVMRNN